MAGRLSDEKESALGHREELGPSVGCLSWKREDACIQLLLEPGMPAQNGEHQLGRTLLCCCGWRRLDPTSLATQVGSQGSRGSLCAPALPGCGVCGAQGAGMCCWMLWAALLKPGPGPPSASSSAGAVPMSPAGSARSLATLKVHGAINTRAQGCQGRPARGGCSTQAAFIAINPVRARVPSERSEKGESSDSKCV